MAKIGDFFVVTLFETHLSWGTHRCTSSRDRIYGEGYIPIPADKARSFNIYNSNYNLTGLGYNEFYATSKDGFFQGVLKSTGCSTGGDRYAKNLHGSGDLKALGDWFNHLNVRPGDKVQVKWVSATELTLERL